MMIDLRGVAGGLLCLLAVGSTASAHVALEAKQAKVGAGYKAVFGVPHGCEGQPTTEVSIDIPEGIIAVKPMPKAGLDAGACRRAPMRAPTGSITARRRAKASSA